jgi:hypothetical protein
MAELADSAVRAASVADITARFVVEVDTTVEAAQASTAAVADSTAVAVAVTAAVDTGKLNSQCKGPFLRSGPLLFARNLRPIA